MNIEEAIEILKDNIKSLEGHTSFKHTNYKKIQAIETLLTAYEKEKEANKKLDKEAQGYLEELAGDGSMNIRRIQELEAELEKEKETSHYIQSQLDIANAKLVEEKEKNKEAYRKANNYLYFNDSADYEVALWGVIRTLRPDLAEKWDNGEDAVLEYIEEE